MYTANPIAICRHYDVEWVSSHVCRCKSCGKQGYWSPQGISIWVRGASIRDRYPPKSPRSLAKAG